LPTLYLQKSGENRFHMVDEKFDYPSPQPNSILKSKPSAFILNGNFNSRNGSYVNFQYQIPKNSPVRIEIFDSHGRKVAIPEKGNRKGAVLHTARWDARQQPAGMYYMRFQADGHSQSKKILIVR